MLAPATNFYFLQDFNMNNTSQLYLQVVAYVIVIVVFLVYFVK